MALDSLCSTSKAALRGSLRLGSWLGMFLCALVLTACGQQAAAGEPTPAPAQEVAQAVAEPELAAEPEAVSAPSDPDHCIDCHSDKERLIDTGAPEAAVEVESEGEG